MTYDIEEVRRKYIGFETAKARGRYPVEYDPIRRHCHMVEDNNPLFIDLTYARNTEHGEVLCPPSGWLALYFASLGPWPAAFEPLFPILPTPGKRIVNMSQQVEWFARIKVGDHLSVVRRIVDAYQKGVQIDPEAVWIVSDIDITNQRDEDVCRIQNTFLAHRSPEEVGHALRGETPLLAEQSAVNRVASAREESPLVAPVSRPASAGRPTDQRHWDDLAVGDELPEIALDINIKRLFLQASGSQDWYPVHFDPTFARKAGHEDVFMNTGFVQAALVRLITDWMGDAGFLKRLYFEMRRQHRPGDTMACRGRVVHKERRDGAACVDLEVWAENHREGITTPAEATVILPLRPAGHQSPSLPNSH